MSGATAGATLDLPARRSTRDAASDGGVRAPRPTAVRPTGNQPCRCGSGWKYKRCCLAGDQVRRRHQTAAALPAWLLTSTGRLHQFEKYLCQVFAWPDALAGLTDHRRAPVIPTFDVIKSLFHTAVLRIPSLNALEGDLKEPDFQRLIGRRPTPARKAFSADTVANVLDKVDGDQLTALLEDVVGRAERNKAFRDGSYGALRCVALDGWEPFASYDRHCSHCLVGTVRRKRADGEVDDVNQYYHAYVVAMLVGPVLDMVLAVEPVRHEEARGDTLSEHVGHEGELTAGYRLVERLHETYGRFIDAFVLDAPYANGPVMSQLAGHGYGGFIVLEKDTNEPLKEALALWQGLPPCEIGDAPAAKEHMAWWDVDDIATLATYPGPVRVIRAVITKADQTPRTWCFGIIGPRARRVSRRTALQIVRSRWHIEDTGFNQWIQYWHLGHVFHHTAHALAALLLVWMVAFNLLQLFVYRRLGRPRRPQDPTETIRHIVEVMLRELATLPEPIPWGALLDTG